MEKAKRNPRQLLLFFILCISLCLVLLIIQFVNQSAVYSDGLPTSGVYHCEELDITLYFDEDTITASYSGNIIPVWVDYGDNLHFDDGDVSPIAAIRWNIKNDTLVLTFRNAPQGAKEKIPYIFSRSD